MVSMLHSNSRYPPPHLVPPAFPPSQPQIPPQGSSLRPTMGKEKERSRIDIILDAPYVSLRGTSGTTVEPAVLSGRVSLYLVEDTDIREVSLHLTGKTKIPVSTSESLINNSSMQSYTFCSHDWSFLESSCTSTNSPSLPSVSSGKRPLPHVRTLKAGCHNFPFNFTLTGDCPSTLTTHPLDLNTAFPSSARASISYKLRAVASRPGLSLGPLHNIHMPMMYNLTCTMPVYVLRTLSPVTLEYQQSVEMESTWPEKLMYAIMLPHRAWAAGDSLIAVLKLSPLAKGVCVESVVTTLWEAIELHVPQHHHLKSALHLPHHGDKSKVVHIERRIVRRIRHKIVNGKAVRVALVTSACAKSSRGCNMPAGSASRAGSRPGSSSGSTSAAGIDSVTPGPALPEEEIRLTDEQFENHDIVTYITFPIPHLATGPFMSTQTTPPTMMPGSSASISIPQSRPPSPPLSSSSYSYSLNPLPGPSTTPSSSRPSSTASVNPTHTLPPIVVSHRICWTFSIRNPDGHTSQLRCTLPIHILDERVLSEARQASVLTRRMCLVAEGLWRGDEHDDELGLGSGGMGTGGGESNESDDDVYRELPSYTAHLRDRVANMYYSEMATVRVPWVDVVAGGEATTTDNLNPEDDNVDGGLSHIPSQSRRHSGLRSASGRSTPGHLPAPDQPDQPLPQAPSPVDWVNSDLMSLSSSSNENTVLAPDSSQAVEVHNRSESPERNPGLPTGSDAHGQLGTTGGGQHVRSLSSLLKATMKPFATLSHLHGNGGYGIFGLSKSSSPQDDPHHVPTSGPSYWHPSPSRRGSIAPTLPSTHSFPAAAAAAPSSSSSTQPLPPLGASSTAVHRSLSEVPDYSVASQGFMGGVPPLSSLMGLPSYEEAARERRRQPQADGNNLHHHDPEDPSTLNADDITSDTSLVERFDRPSRMGIQQRLEM